MAKLSNHRSAIMAVITEYDRKTLVYGEHDCAMFAAECLKAATGRDLLEEFRGKYSDYETGLALMAEKGFKSHVEYITNGLKKIHPSRAKFGDLCIVETGDQTGTTVGVCGGGFVLVMGPRGLIRIGLLSKQVLSAWSVEQ